MKTKKKIKTTKKIKIKSAKKSQTKKSKLAKQLITKNMLIGEVVQKHPKAVEVMFEYGLHCIGCHVSAFESIESGALAHGLTPKQIEEMLKKMNEKVKKK